jgi:hypothetical protein
MCQQAQAQGQKHLNAALTDAAMAALRTNDSYLQALYRRKKPQLGHGRALGAVKHSMLCAVWHMLSTGELYNDLGGEYSPAATQRSDTAPRRSDRTPRTCRDPGGGTPGGLKRRGIRTALPGSRSQPQASFPTRGGEIPHGTRRRGSPRHTSRLARQRRDFQSARDKP